MKMSSHSVLAALAILCLFSCVSHCATEHNTIDNVRAVYMHDSNTYSFLIIDRNTDREYTKSFDANTVRFVRDVPTGQLLWVEFDDNSHPCQGTGDSLTVHLQADTQVQGGSWDYGKSGNGTTNLIDQVPTEVRSENSSEKL